MKWDFLWFPANQDSNAVIKAQHSRVGCCLTDKKPSTEARQKEVKPVVSATSLKKIESSKKWLFLPNRLIKFPMQTVAVYPRSLRA